MTLHATSRKSQTYFFGYEGYVSYMLNTCDFPLCVNVGYYTHPSFLPTRACHLRVGVPLTCTSSLSRVCASLTAMCILSFVTSSFVFENRLQHARDRSRRETKKKSCRINKPTNQPTPLTFSSSSILTWHEPLAEDFVEIASVVALVVSF